ncbi:(d)CMP kinase [Anaeromicropila herbilytica]|uniref:Cytidylate kinase n=1 Tax=Anaeromicropila herbilytica TaxID=2785025 RepID=A0A7R7EM57_9FIRM|nr:(d)CMP kinase [Anaeromicropila herbilytica]BCN31421.1 cytidylate kinase [Anaeromicropila herbilytica]
MNYSIAIDGPAGAGKSTIAKSIAQKLEFIYVDTGAMYRAIAFYFLRNGIKPEENQKIQECIHEINITIEYEGDVQQVILNDENVTAHLRTEEVGNMASKFATNRDVRLKLVDLQRNIASTKNVIMDGRDIGTYVLPNANLKVYLTASSTERAKRRWLELKNKGIESDINEIEQDIIQRDEQDMNREFAPLRKADDAILLDSSNMTIDEVVNEIIELYRKGLIN